MDSLNSHQLGEEPSYRDPSRNQDPFVTTKRFVYLTLEGRDGSPREVTHDKTNNKYCCTCTKGSGWNGYCEHIKEAKEIVDEVGPC